MSEPIKLDLEDLERQAAEASRLDVPEFTGALVLELVQRLRTAEDAARFFYAKHLIEGILLDEQCGELERHEAAIENIAARCAGLPVEVVDDGDPFLELSEVDYQFDCGGSTCGVCKGTGVFDGRKCYGIPF